MINKNKYIYLIYNQLIILPKKCNEQIEGKLRKNFGSLMNIKRLSLAYQLRIDSENHLFRVLPEFFINMYNRRRRRFILPFYHQ